MRDGEARTRLVADRGRAGWGPRWGFVGSAVLHAALAGLILLALWERQKPDEPPATGAYELEFDGAERPPQSGADGAPAMADLPSDLPLPPALADIPPLLQPPPGVNVPEPVVPPLPGVPLPPSPAILAMPSLPPPPTAPVAPAPPADAADAPQDFAALPLPPPAAPPAPVRPTVQPTPRPVPPRPTPQAMPSVPGLWLPEGAALVPRPSRPRPGGSPSLNLAPSDGAPGQAQIEDVLVEGAKVGPDWYREFVRWVREHWRYPVEAVALGQQGMNRLEVVADPDGRVRQVRLVAPSGMIYLDFRSQVLFRGATLPRFPPDADPKGVTLKLRMRYILTSR